MTSSRFSELADIISDSTSKLQTYYASKGWELPSLSPSGPLGFNIAVEDTELVQTRDKLESALLELYNITRGPFALLMDTAFHGANDILALQAISRFGIAKKVPHDEHGVTFADLANECGVNERDLTRFIRLAVSNHVLNERDGRVLHSPASKLLAGRDSIAQIIALQTEEYPPSAAKSLDAVTKNNGIHRPEQSGFSLANGLSHGIYAEWERSPERGARWANAMGALANQIPLPPFAAVLESLMEWSVPRVFVDVGGGRGPVSIGLAKRFPSASFFVQDLEHVIEGGPLLAEAEGVPQVKFEVGDFLQKQTRAGADVYYLRAIFANWVDDSCVDILRNVASVAAPKSSHILIDDGLHESDSPFLNTATRKIIRSFDLTMMTYFGGKLRTLEDWKTLLHRTDPRLQLKSAKVIGDRIVLDVVMGSPDDNFLSLNAEVEIEHILPSK